MKCDLVLLACFVGACSFLAAQAAPLDGERIQQLTGLKGTPAGATFKVTRPRTDVPDNAARVTRLGVGRTLPRSRYTAGRVARELAALLATPEISAAATVLATRIRAERGTAVACDALNESGQTARRTTR